MAVRISEARGSRQHADGGVSPEPDPIRIAGRDGAAAGGRRSGELHGTAPPFVDFRVAIAEGKATAIAVGGGGKIDPFGDIRAYRQGPIVNAPGTLVHHQEDLRATDPGEVRRLAKSGPGTVVLVAAMRSGQPRPVGGKGGHTPVIVLRPGGSELRVHGADTLVQGNTEGRPDGLAPHGDSQPVSGVRALARVGWTLEDADAAGNIGRDKGLGGIR